MSAIGAGVWQGGCTHCGVACIVAVAHGSRSTCARLSALVVVIVLFVSGVRARRVVRILICIRTILRPPSPGTILNLRGNNPESRGANPERSGGNPKSTGEILTPTPRAPQDFRRWCREGERHLRHPLGQRGQPEPRGRRTPFFSTRSTNRVSPVGSIGRTSS